MGCHHFAASEVFQAEDAGVTSTDVLRARFHGFAPG